MVRPRRSNLDGSGATVVTKEVTSDTAPSVSWDGKSLLLPSLAVPEPGLLRLNTATGEKEKISDIYCAFPEYSPDGKWDLVLATGHADTADSTKRGSGGEAA